MKQIQEANVKIYELSDLVPLAVVGQHYRGNGEGKVPHH